MLALQRSLALGALPVPQTSQPPLSPSTVHKPKYITQPCRGPLPHQPWSFNAGLGIRAVYRKNNPNPVAVGVQQRGGGDVIPSVTSIDEGVEMRSISPREMEMVRKFAIVVKDWNSYNSFLGFTVQFYLLSVKAN